MFTKLASALFMASLATSAHAQQIGGTYSAHGTNLDGSKYEGTAEITWTSDVTCAINWKTGSTTSTGICMRDRNAFVAGYNLQGKIGLIIYQVGTDGTLRGSWTIDGMNAVGSEVLTPL